MTEPAPSRFKLRPSALLPVVLGAIATFFFLGDLGKFSDDWRLAIINPVTGEAKLGFDTWKMWPGFWRPLQMLYLSNSQTIFWNHDRILHLFNALAHALTAYLVWRLLARLCRSPHVAAAGGLLFLTCPIGYEVPLWCSAFAAAPATALFLIVAILCVDLAQGRRGWKWLPLMALLAYAIPNWYEEPATGLAAFPLLYWAAAPVSEPPVKRFVRGLFVTFVLCLTSVLYIVLLRATAPDWARGSATSFTRLERLPEKLAEAAHHFRNLLLLVDFWPGALRHGWRQFIGHGWATAAWALVLAVAAVLWARAWMSAPSGSPTPTDAASPCGRLFACVFGVAVFFLGWLPAVAIATQWPAARMCYFMILGPLIVLAVTTDALADAARRRARERAFRLAVGTATLTACLAGSLILVGIQSNFRLRYRADMREAAQLIEIVPDPAPGTVFVPLKLDFLPVRTGSPAFDTAVEGVFGMSWTPPYFLQHQYRRDDVTGTFYHRWSGDHFAAVGADGLKYMYELGAGLGFDAANGVIVPWERVIPFVVNTDGELRIVTSITLARNDNQDTVVQLPRVETIRISRSLPDLNFVIDARPDPSAVDPLSGWHWSASGEPAVFQSAASWESHYVCLHMHPEDPSVSGTSAIRTVLPPTDRPSRLHFRVTIPDWLAPHSLKGDGAEFIWYLDGERDRPLERQTLSPQDISREGRWIPVSMTIPPHDSAVTLHVELLARGNPYYDGSWVTQGFRAVGE